MKKFINYRFVAFSVWLSMIFIFGGGVGLLAEESDKSHGPAPQSEAIRRMEARIISRINEVREEHDLPALEEKEILNEVARDYSRRMVRKEFFSHYGPSGGTVADRVEAAGLRYRRVGENLAVTDNIDQPAEGLVGDWMDSPSHRKNILDENYVQTGVGIWEEDDRYYFTQVFMQSMGSFQKERENPEE